MPNVSADAVQSCEAILRKEMVYNIAHKIWSSVSRIIERMLALRIEQQDAYDADLNRTDQNTKPVTSRNRIAEHESVDL